MHVVRLEGSTNQADSDGSFTPAWAALSPATVWASIEPATARGLERVVAATVESSATHIVTMPYHAGVTTKTRILFKGRVFSVTGVANPDERNEETIAVCAEMVT